VILLQLSYPLVSLTQAILESGDLILVLLLHFNNGLGLLFKLFFIAFSNSFLDLDELKLVLEVRRQLLDLLVTGFKVICQPLALVDGGLPLLSFLPEVLL